VIRHGKAAQVGRGELTNTQVDEVNLCGFCNISNRVGFSNAGCAPDHNRLEKMFFNKSAEQMFELGWIHLRLF